MNRRNADRKDATDTALIMLHDALDGAVSWDGTPVPHYEHVREAATPPYYASGPSDMTPDATQSSNGRYGGAQTVDVQLDTYSSYRGKKQVAQLQHRAIDALGAAAVADGSGRRLSLNRVLNTRIQEEPQESRATYHGIATVRFRIQLAAP